MLRGGIRSDPGYIESWGTHKGLLDLWQGDAGLLVRGRCTDIVELYSWLLPSIQNAHPGQTLQLEDIAIPELEEERARLRIELWLYLSQHSTAMDRVTPSRFVSGSYER